MSSTAACERGLISQGNAIGWLRGPSLVAHLTAYTTNLITHLIVPDVCPTGGSITFPLSSFAFEMLNTERMDVTARYTDVSARTRPGQIL